MRTVMGKVTTVKDEPIQNVDVLVTDTTVGAVTNSSLNILNDAQSLTFELANALQTVLK